MGLYLSIALGGALGSIVRFAISDYMTARWGTGFPWGTLAVNAIGSLLIGVLFFLTMTPHNGITLSSHWKHFIMVGFCGGFTTFSTFSLEMWLQCREGAWLRMFGYTASSLVICLLAVGLGYSLVSYWSK